MNAQTIQLLTQLYKGRQMTMPEQLNLFNLIERALERRSWGIYPENNDSKSSLDNLTMTMLGQNFPHLTHAGRKHFIQTFLPRIKRLQFRFYHASDFETWHKSFAENFGAQNVCFPQVEEVPMYEGTERIDTKEPLVDEEPSLMCFHDSYLLSEGYEHKSDERGCWVQTAA
ncbi:hypothetical protein LTR78_001813 [Recurvomyces mirabilis]|uniref:Uncharacterized protein n=1 Tax=Recurvomyces mirabilis TaxID=574656 RepID=A0AAE1C599_9PEZI|nr:hypothetical protein LTR78_001813 [Recurvomyces mirabilis]KAK5156746.1 hypothetical protein LTS14_004959 [Recurvomyces mirabilis]